MNVANWLLWSGVTGLIYGGCRWMFVRTRLPLLHPGFTAVMLVYALLEATGRRFYGDFAAAMGWINWLLGPAVVAMAVPIYQLRHVVRANWRGLALIVPLGLVVAVVSTTLMLALGGATRPLVAAGALKSITSPVAYRLAADAGVPVDATLAGVLFAGMLGATMGPTVLRWIGVKDERAVGLAMGVSAHGFGTARALELNRTAGAFASIAMSGSAMLGSVVLPFVLRWIVARG